MTTSAAAVRAEAPAHFRDLIFAEWIKLRSLRSMPWALGLTALIVVGSAVLQARGDVNAAKIPADHGFSISAAFPSFGAQTLMLVAGSLGVIAIAGEYGSGLIRTTTVAVPARGSVVLAKAVVQAVLWTVAGAVMSTVSFVVAQSILDGRHVGVSITYPGAFPAVLGATLVAPVCALTGLGLGVLIRNTAGTIVTSVVLLQLLQPFLSPAQPSSALLNHAMVLSAWLRLTENAGPPEVASYPYAPLSECWIVYAAWPLVAMALALIVVRKRDV